MPNDNTNPTSDDNVNDKVEQDPTVDPEVDPAKTDEDDKPDEDEPAELTIEDAKAALEKTRKEAANYRRKHKDLDAQYKALEARLAEMKSAEDIEQLVADMKTEREAAERALLAENVGLQYKLPPALSKLLQGDTREALEAHAKELAALIPSTTQQTTPSGGLRPSPGGGSDERSAEDIAAQVKRERY